MSSENKLKNPKRSLIRQKIADKLKNLVQGRVFLSRIYPLPEGAPPALSIFANREVADNDNTAINQGQRLIWHVLTLTVQVHVSANQDMDEAIDEIEAQVRTLLLADVTLDGLSEDLRWVSTDIELSGGGVKPTAIADIVFEIFFRN